ncbi:MAG: 50S ribosomal protein L20 [Candidatus Pacebacteria bacterium]|nr:50S ribosomal protein L20 [Candidatus Paceibacterota bacterium]
MSRAKTGTVRRKKHKKILKLAKGFKGTNSRLFKRAHEAVLHAGQYAYKGRKLRKRDFRKLWIMRIGAALETVDSKLNYSRFIHALKQGKVQLNRKMLSELAVKDLDVFKKVVDKVSK